LDYLAHSENLFGHTDMLQVHLSRVAKRAEEYAAAFEAGEEARLVGLLHDLGKYGDLFQDRLKGKARRIDHWSQGAWAALNCYRQKGIAAALVIQGHHIGLQRATSADLRSLDPQRLQENHPLGLRLSDPRLQSLLQRFNGDGMILPDPSTLPESLYNGLGIKRACASMLDVRMLFSALVDADFIETEAHFESVAAGSTQYREAGLSLDPKWALDILLAGLNRIAAKAEASSRVKQLRKDLLSACLDAALLPQGIFTLTAPTGTGKTLSSLAFALRHAADHGLHRIIFVIPFLSIIEQTARSYRDVFEPHLHSSDLERYILEHHSLAGIHGSEWRSSNDNSDPENTQTNSNRLLSENWDAPIIITTNVQLLESLFSNRPSACRKLHNLAGSVIIFDEVQTLPVGLAVPTLATLSHLVERYHTTVVFTTATQPAFSSLSETTRRLSGYEWHPREIVPPDLDLFARAKRTRLEWPDPKCTVTWDALANEIAGHERVLCIVNLKRHALLLFEALKLLNAEGVFHLSTNMCPAHRMAVLSQIRKLLDARKSCRLISTQCIEAGVDVDFPVVYRSFAPLEAIAQAGGRCNRNGREQYGVIYVFRPEDERYPDATYKQAAIVTRILLNERRELDIDNPETFSNYYRNFFNIAEPEKRKAELLEAIQDQDFVRVASEYRLIEKDGINILVAYDRPIFRELAEEVREFGINRKWILKARPHSIGIFRPTKNDPVLNWIEPAPLLKGVANGRSDEWFIYLNEEHYDKEKGLIPPAKAECIIA